MTNITERPITPNERLEFGDYSKKGANLIGLLDDTTDPVKIVEAVDTYVYDKQLLLKQGSLKLSDDEIIDSSLALGCFWGNQLVRAFGWEWVCVLFNDKEEYSVVSPDRSLAVYATYYVRACFDYLDADVTILLAYNMIAAGRFSGERPKSYHKVMRDIYHIVPRG
jgi:hypothetical protein